MVILDCNMKKLRLLFAAIFCIGLNFIQAQTIKDIDGNIYNPIKIGNQIWLIENLKTTRYSNGDTIPNVKDTIEWHILQTGAYANYNNSDSLVNKYGRLYNWPVVNDPKGLAPKGWHVASRKEWEELIDTLGGLEEAKNKLMESTWWTSEDLLPSKSCGFNALPGGFRSSETGARYGAIGNTAYWWTSTLDEQWPSDPISITIGSYNSVEIGSDIRRYGHSVRCIKDK